MASVRPVIFIYPISANLTKLKEEMKNDPTLEIHEVDNTNEVVQLFLTVAPAMILTSDIKKAFRVLATVEKQYKKTSSKMLLLHKDKIPLKAQQKGEKLGLTTIEEPVSPRSLVYKVNLLLKSLPTNKIDAHSGELELKKQDEAKEQEALGEELSIQEASDKHEQIESPQNGALKGSISAESNAHNYIDKFMELKTKNKIKLEIEDDITEKDSDEERSEPEIEKKKDKKSLQIDFIDDDIKEQESDLEDSQRIALENEIKSKKQKGNLDFGQEDARPEKDPSSKEESQNKSKGPLALEFEEELDGQIGSEKKHKKVDIIDKYLRNPTIKKTNLELEEENSEKDKETNAHHEEIVKKNKSPIEFSEENTEANAKDNKENSDVENKKKNKSSMLLDFDDTPEALSDVESLDLEKSQALKKKNKTNFEDEALLDIDEPRDRDNEIRKKERKKNSSIDAIDENEHEKEESQAKDLKAKQKTPFSKLKVEDATQDIALNHPENPLTKKDHDTDGDKSDKESNQGPKKSTKTNKIEITAEEKNKQHEKDDEPNEEDDRPGLRAAKRLKLLTGLDNAIEAFEKNGQAENVDAKKNDASNPISEGETERSERDENEKNERENKRTKKLNLDDESLTRDAEVANAEDENVKREKNETLPDDEEVAQTDSIAFNKKNKNAKAQNEEDADFGDENPEQEVGPETTYEFVKNEEEEKKRTKKRETGSSNMKGEGTFQQDDTSEQMRSKNKTNATDDNLGANQFEESNNKKGNIPPSNSLDTGDNDQDQYATNSAKSKNDTNAHSQDQDEYKEVEFSERGKKSRKNSQDSDEQKDDSTDLPAEEKLSTHGLSILIKSLHQYHSAENQREHFVNESISFFKAQGGFLYLGLTPQDGEEIEFINIFPDISQKNGDFDLVSLLIQSDLEFERKWKLKGQSLIFFYPIQLKSGARARAILAFPSIIDSDQKWQAQAKIESLRPWLEGYQASATQPENIPETEMKEISKNILSELKNWFKRIAS